MNLSASVSDSDSGPFEAEGVRLTRARFTPQLQSCLIQLVSGVLFLISASCQLIWLSCLLSFSFLTVDSSGQWQLMTMHAGSTLPGM